MLREDVRELLPPLGKVLRKNDDEIMAIIERWDTRERHRESAWRAWIDGRDQHERRLQLISQQLDAWESIDRWIAEATRGAVDVLEPESGPALVRRRIGSPIEGGVWEEFTAHSRLDVGPDSHRAIAGWFPAHLAKSNRVTYRAILPFPSGIGPDEMRDLDDDDHVALAAAIYEARFGGRARQHNLWFKRAAPFAQQLMSRLWREKISPREIPGDAYSDLVSKVKSINGSQNDDIAEIIRSAIDRFEPRTSVAWIARKDAARAAGVAEGTITRWVDKKLIEGNGVSGRGVRINAASLTMFLAKRNTPSEETYAQVERKCADIPD